jgi:hypothetical protein
MGIKPDKLVKSMLGDDFFQVLEKSDVYKMYNRNATSVDEIATGLKIVPRAVMSFLISNLSGLQVNDNRDLQLPFAPDCYIQVTKKDNDTFSGYLYSNGKKINEFVNRSIPGIGLVLMTTFELYDTENIKKEKESFDVNKLQQIIDERLRLHSLISRVVDQKLDQRDAIEILVKEKIAQILAAKEPEEKEEEKTTKSDKLKEFLQKQKEKKQEAVEIEKTEAISCPDCGSGLYDGGKNLTLCICYGEDWNKNIKIQKSENNFKMKFPKSMDDENVGMLLQTLKNINKE